VQVIHVFSEPSVFGQEEHLDVWFGRTHAADELDEGKFPIVCFCGGRLEPLRFKDGEVDVAGVWHLRSYPWAMP
jgi:hypothetical protein